MNTMPFTFKKLLSQTTAVLTIVILLLTAASVTPAFADDELPPAPATEEPVQSPTPEPILATEPAATEVPSEEATSIVTVVATEAEEVSDSPSVVEEVSTGEILEIVPEDTAIVVLVDGQVEPLATQNAANILVNGDPVWCPATVAAPTPGANGCTASYSSLQNLLNDLDLAEKTEAGTIWIESSYDSSLNDPDSSGFVISGATFTTMMNHDLTIQGGWSGISGDAEIGTASTFNGDFLHINGWAGNIFVNNIVFTGVSELYIDTSADISLDEVHADHIDGSGVNIEADGNITVTNSSFNDNSRSGLYARSNNGYITLDGVEANRNLGVGGDGAVLFADGNITVMNSEFNNNALDSAGLYLYSYHGTVTLNNVIAGGTDSGTNLQAFGVRAFGDQVSITNSIFNNNTSMGVYIQSDNGPVELSNVTASNNTGRAGTMIDAYGDTTIMNSRFNDNALWGLLVTSHGGQVTLNGVISSGNYFGTWIEAENADINIMNGIFSANRSHGVYLKTQGNASISCSEINSNGGYGVNAVDVVGSLALDSIVFGVDTERNIAGDYAYGGSATISTVECNPVTPTETATPPTETVTPPTETPAPPTETPGPPMMAISGDSQQEQEPSNDGTAPLYFIIAQTREQLPDVLGAGNTFGSVLKVILTPEGEKISGLTITLSFPIPDNMKDTRLAVMLWNGTGWVGVPGGSVVNGYLVITVAGPGVYALVSQ